MIYAGGAGEAYCTPSLPTPVSSVRFDLRRPAVAVLFVGGLLSLSRGGNHSSLRDYCTNALVCCNLRRRLRCGERARCLCPLHQSLVEASGAEMLLFVGRNSANLSIKPKVLVPCFALLTRYQDLSGRAHGRLTATMLSHLEWTAGDGWPASKAEHLTVQPNLFVFFPLVTVKRLPTIKPWWRLAMLDVPLWRTHRP